MKKNGDLSILSDIAKYKFLTVKQISFLQQRSIPVIRRRLRFLNEKKLVSILERVFAPGPGRNEHIAILSDKGHNVLKSENILNGSAGKINNQAYDFTLIEHDLLLNWFLIHLVQLERMKPRFKIFTITSNSQHLFSDKLNQAIRIEPISDNEDSDNERIMIPDAVFTITDEPSKKTLLFFLEVDRGTEPLTSAAQNPKSIEHKINAYKGLFKSKVYRQYNKMTKKPLNGFRLLFLTSTVARMNSICRLTQNMPPSNFIWVTNQAMMFEKGVSAKVWIRGGHLDKSCESILNEKLAFESPVVIK